MNLARIATYFSFSALFLTYVITGYTISLNAGLWAHVFDHFFHGKPLPGLTLFIIYFDASNWPIIRGTVAGLIFVFVLCFLDRNPGTQKWVPLVLTIAWIPCVLHLLAFVLSIGLVFPWEWYP